MDSETFAIVPIEALDALDFSLLRQDGPDTCRRSIDGLLAVVSWVGERPDGIEGEEYGLDEIQVIMQTEEWSQVIE